ncbi:MAG: metal ABC transporter permease [Evtepia sp.]
MILWLTSYNQMMLSAVHQALADSRGIQVVWKNFLFTAAISVVVTISMTWVGLLVINALLVLPGAAARNLAKNLPQYHLISILGGIVCGIAGLMVSYCPGTSTGASITLLLAVWFFVTLLVRRAH